jgi:hypothetical protein
VTDWLLGDVVHRIYLLFGCLVLLVVVIVVRSLD